MFNPGKKDSAGIKYLRNICLTFDSFIYMVLTLVFKVFFNLTSADFLDNEIMTNFYNNIQLLLGIYITFNLCFSFFAYLVDPDKLSDNKVGASKLITRIVTALLMLTLLLPLSGIPDSDAPERSYNLAIKQKGILFGTLQIVQDRIIDQNVIGALVLGNNTNRINGTYDAQADMFVADILKAFIFKNTNNCDNDSFDNYDITTDYTTIIDYASSKTCDGSKSYAYSYIFLGSWICGVILIFVVAGFCVDVAIRLIKLSILRLIAPIPIISYINPNSKNNSFNSWVKMVTSTYLDLFIRIGTIYLVVYICSTLLGNDVLVFSSNNFWINLLSKIIIYIALFLFAKQAPKFLMDMLGIKSDGKGFFSGIGAIAGFGALTGGLIGSAATGWRASAEENRMAGRTNPVANAFRNLASAATSTIGGAWVGGRAAFTSKDHDSTAIRNAQQQRNALRAAHSTLIGRINDNLSTMLTGRSLAQRDQGILDLSNTAASSISKWKEMVQQEAIKNGDYGLLDYTDINTGQRVRGNFNYAKVERLLQNATGNTFEYDGNTYYVDDFSSDNMAKLLDSQTKYYMAGASRAGGKSYARQIERGGKLFSQRRQAMFDANAAGINNNLDRYNELGKAIGTAYTQASDMSNDLRHIARRANSQANGNNHK